MATAHSRKRERGGETKKWAKIIHVVIEEGKVNLPVSMRVFCSVMSWRMQCNERMRRKLMDVTAIHSFGQGIKRSKVWMKKGKGLCEKENLKFEI